MTHSNQYDKETVMDNTTTPPINAGSVLDSLKAACRKQPFISYETRKQVLCQIEEILLENDQDICDAVSKDFGHRSVHETKFLEIATIIMSLRYTRKKLKKWMKPQKRHVSMIFTGGKNRVMPQAKGVVGIAAPWNYPLFLVMSPLTSAIAAGNRVMVKMAANSQRLCRLLQKRFAEKISEELITFLPGVNASDFSCLPFDHLVFTGSPGTGREVMRAAAQHLTPVTLELGGKSPTIVADDFNMKIAVERIMYAKLMNSGQMCVAPDYLFLPDGKTDEFINIAKAVVSRRYPEIEVNDYTSIIDQKAYQRLMETLEDARQKNARIIHLIPGKKFDENKRKISPIIVTHVTTDMRMMQEEIFGPILPIMTYTNLDEAIDYVNDHDRPLALYIFSNNRQVQDNVLQKTLSGGVTINDCAMHVPQHDLPFGGIGNSGMGQYHGYEGFTELSKMKPVFKQSKIAVSFAPPYGKISDTIYNVMTKIKWLK